jgi:metal-sulfur cluster biosynthetic enzyme
MTNTEITPNKPVWDIEKSNPELLIPLRAAFQQVLDPELGMSILQLGLVRNVQVNDGMLVVSMIMTTPFCPYAPALIESTKDMAKSVVQMEVVIALNMEPWDFTMMENPEGFEWGMWQ